MRVIFCDDPLTRRGPDPTTPRRRRPSAPSGRHALVSYEALVNDRDAAAAVRRVDASERPEPGLYRGWMLRPEQYAALYGALADEESTSSTTRPAYRHCHHLPESYAVIEGRTPRSVWLRADRGWDWTG